LCGIIPVKVKAIHANESAAIRAEIEAINLASEFMLPAVPLLVVSQKRNAGFIQLRKTSATTRRIAEETSANYFTRSSNPPCSTQRAGIACFAFISGPAAFVGGVPLTRAMNPWAMPEAST